MAGLLGKVYLTMAHVLDTQNRKRIFKLGTKTYLEMCLGMKQFNRLNEVTYDDNAQTGLFAVANKSTCPEILFQICI